tara:strand:+ start:425 stop:670 length:246 start_codon:yes stop_codon:yes gene_type:complete
MVDESTTKNIAYFIFIISFFVMVYFIINQAKHNRKSSIEVNAPKVAGSDQISGGAKDPTAFEEPDDDALEEMAELLGEMDD